MRANSPSLIKKDDLKECPRTPAFKQKSIAKIACNIGTGLGVFGTLGNAAMLIAKVGDVETSAAYTIAALALTGSLLIIRKLIS